MRRYQRLAVWPGCLNSGRVASSPVLRHGLGSNNIITKTALLTFSTPQHSTPASTRFFHVSSSISISHKMSASLIPANPAELMVIRNVTPNVVTFSVPFARFGRIQIGGRGTLGMYNYPYSYYLLLDVSPFPHNKGLAPRRSHQAMHLC